MKTNIETKGRGERLSAEAAAAILANPPPILTVPEAAALCRVSARTLRGHVADRRIPIIRLGGRVLIRRDELLKALDRMSVAVVG